MKPVVGWLGRLEDDGAVARHRDSLIGGQGRRRLRRGVGEVVEPDEASCQDHDQDDHERGQSDAAPVTSHGAVSATVSRPSASRWRRLLPSADDDRCRPRARRVPARQMTLAEALLPPALGERAPAWARDLRARRCRAPPCSSLGAYVTFTVPAVQLGGLYVPVNEYVPLTLQTFGVLFTGALLGARRGLSATGLYLLLGIVGLPVFAAGADGVHRAGLDTIVGVEGGRIVLGRHGRLSAGLPARLGRRRAASRNAAGTAGRSARWRPWSSGTAHHLRLRRGLAGHRPPASRCRTRCSSASGRSCPVTS